MKILSRSEEIVLLAIWKLQAEAYGVEIRKKVSRATGRMPGDMDNGESCVSDANRVAILNNFIYFAGREWEIPAKVRHLCRSNNRVTPLNDGGRVLVSHNRTPQTVTHSGQPGGMINVKMSDQNGSNALQIDPSRLEIGQVRNHIVQMPRVNQHTTFAALNQISSLRSE